MWTPHNLARPSFGTLLSVVLSLTVPVCGCKEKSANRVSPRPDVLVITIDTARADYFSFFGNSPVKTVNVDRLAADGVAFLQAIAPAPITLPSHASLFTGRLPLRHGVRANGAFRLPDAETTLAEILQSAGYHTGAFVGAAVLDAHYGFAQGFDTYDDTVHQTYGSRSFATRRGEEVVQAAKTWLAVQKGPTFVWVHLFDAHKPYDPPEPERSRYPASPYGAEIAYADRVVGTLVDAYRKSGRYDNAVVVLAADHGESLGEHGENTHGVFIYDATLHVPLVLKAPGFPRGGRVPEQVRLVDVLPTVLAALRLPTPDSIDGVDLAPLMGGHAQDATRFAYIESLYPKVNFGWSPLHGLRTAKRKLILGVQPELYDLEKDPQEKTNLAAAKPAEVQELKAILAARFPDDEGKKSEAELDAESRAQLLALGYVWAPSTKTPEPADPRKEIGVIVAMDAAVRLYESGQRAQGLAQLTELVRREPNNPHLLAELGKLQRSSGDFEGALASFTQAANAAADDPRFHSDRGALLQRLGRKDEAIVAYERALALDPKQETSRHNRWQLLLDRGRAKDVLVETNSAVGRDPKDGHALTFQLLARFVGKPREALAEAVAAALRRLPEDPWLHLLMATVLEQIGKTQEAIPHYGAVLSASFPNEHAVQRYARLQLDQGELEKALQALNQAVARDLTSIDTLFLLAEARAKAGDHAGSLAALGQAIEQAPKRADLWSAVADVQLADGHHEEALASYQRAIDLGIRRPQSWANLVHLYQQLGNQRQAEAILRRAQALGLAPANMSAR